jgi:hypothetical protein
MCQWRMWTVALGLYSRHLSLGQEEGLFTIAWLYKTPRASPTTPCTFFILSNFSKYVSFITNELGPKHFKQGRIRV